MRCNKVVSNHLALKKDLKDQNRFITSSAELKFCSDFVLEEEEEVQSAFLVIKICLFKVECETVCIVKNKNE